MTHQLQFGGLSNTMSNRSSNVGSNVASDRMEESSSRVLALAFLSQAFDQLASLAQDGSARPSARICAAAQVLVLADHVGTSMPKRTVIAKTETSESSAQTDGSAQMEMASQMAQHASQLLRT